MQTSHLSLKQQARSRRKGCVVIGIKQPFCIINLILSQLSRKLVPWSLGWIIRIKNPIKRKASRGYSCHLPMVYADCSGEEGSQQNNQHRLPEQLLSAFSPFSCQEGSMSRTASPLVFRGQKYFSTVLKKPRFSSKLRMIILEISVLSDTTRSWQIKTPNPQSGKQTNTTTKIIVCQMEFMCQMSWLQKPASSFLKAWTTNEEFLQNPTTPQKNVFHEAIWQAGF